LIGVGRKPTQFTGSGASTAGAIPRILLSEGRRSQALIGRRLTRM
jgi:hypothetical protein